MEIAKIFHGELSGKEIYNMGKSEAELPMKIMSSTYKSKIRITME